MNPLKQRIAIAEWCGYVLSPPLDKEKSFIGWVKDNQYFPILPDYLNDLNAMKGAELMLKSTEKSIFFGYLYKSAGCMQECIFLTAAQRAEAFLKAINRWEE